MTRQKESLTTFFVKETHIYSHCPSSSVYEQQDAAECFEKILSLTSPDASQVKTNSKSEKICKLNEKNIVNERLYFCAFRSSTDG